MDFKLRVLVACEFSQIVTTAFRKRGHEAFSCDILLCEGGHPEWHIQGDVLEILDKGWDLMIAHPPCTHIAVSGSPSFAKKRMDGRQQRAIDFFMEMVNAPIERIAVENPVCIMSTKYRKPDQIIQPYFFGEPVPKKTCLWLKNLPLLKPTNIVEPEYVYYNSKKTKSGKSKYSIYGRLGSGKGKERSVFFKGIAEAMADQWGEVKRKIIPAQQDLFISA